jgi:hypothetical protein
VYEKEINRTFIQTREFSRQWEDLGFDDEDLRLLEIMIMQNPEAGVVMQGTGGLRKMRFAYEGRGKSGSARVCYVDFVAFDTVYLITAFGKSQKANLTKAERNNIKKAIDFLQEEIRQAHGGDRND